MHAALNPAPTLEAEWLPIAFVVWATCLTVAIVIFMFKVIAAMGPTPPDHRPPAKVEDEKETDSRP